MMKYYDLQNNDDDDSDVVTVLRAVSIDLHNIYSHRHFQAVPRMLAPIAEESNYHIICHGCA